MMKVGLIKLVCKNIDNYLVLCSDNSSYEDPPFSCYRPACNNSASIIKNVKDYFHNHNMHVHTN